MINPFDFTCSCFSGCPICDPINLARDPFKSFSDDFLNLDPFETIGFDVERRGSFNRRICTHQIEGPDRRAKMFQFPHKSQTGAYIQEFSYGG